MQICTPRWMTCRTPIARYIRAADVMPDRLDAQLKAGAMLLMGNRFAEAKTKAETVLEKEPRNAGALMLLGNALAGLNDMSGAFQRLNEAIEADPGPVSPTPISALYNWLVATGRWRKHRSRKR